MDTFSNVDYSNTESFEKAIEAYKNLIKPVLKSAGVINIGRNQALTDTINYMSNQLKPLFDQNYRRVIIPAGEVRRVFGNLIDVYR